MKVRSNIKTEKAVRIFTDREEPRAAFWKKYDEVKAELSGESNVNVLAYYGIGGIGKSTLLKKLMTEIDEKVKSPRYVYIDLEKQQERREVLSKIAFMLSEKYKFTFPVFELALYTYAKKSGEKVSQEEIKGLIEKSPALKIGLKIADALTGSVVTKLMEIGDESWAYFRKILLKHKQDLLRMEYIESDELYRNLSYYFSLDMQNNLKQTKEPLVILIDTYEKLVNELSSVGEPLSADLWIRGTEGIVQNIPNVLWIIAGREKLKWERFDSDWSSALEQHLLGDLSTADSDYFLLHAGFNDKNLREKLYMLTNGTPVYLDLCVDQLETIMERGEEPTEAMFGNDTDELIEKFVRYMSDSAKDMVYIFACLKNWNDDIIMQLAPKIISNFSISAYEKTKDYSFVSVSDNGDYVIHQTVGNVLQKNCPRILKTRISDVIMETYSEIVTGKDTSTSDKILPLKYVLKAGMLLCEDRKDFFDFYKEYIRANMRDVMASGFYEFGKSIFDTVLKRAEEIKNDNIYIMVLNDKSWMEAANENYNEALEIQDEVVRMCKEVYGENDIRTATYMANYSARLEETGKRDDAINIMRECVRKYTEIYDAENVKTLGLKSGLGSMLCRAKMYDEALEILESVVNDFIELLGENNEKVAAAMERLADVLYAVGKCDRGKELYEKAISIYENIYGKESLKVMRTITNLSFQLLDAGQKDEALQFRERVYLSYKENYGEDNPNTLDAKGDLADAMGAIGKYEESVKVYEEIIDKRMELFGENHRSTLIDMGSLVSAYVDLEEYEKALELSNAIYNKYAELFGDMHPLTIEAMMGCSHIFAIIGDDEGEYETDKKVYECCMELYGEDNPKTLQALSNLASSTGKTGDMDKAIEYEEKVILKRSKILGESHPETLDSMKNLAISFRDTEEYEKALELGKKVLSKTIENFGENHPRTLKAMSEIAYTLNDMEEYEESALYFAKTLEIRRREGGDIVALIDNIEYLADAYYYMEDIENELPLREEAAEKWREIRGEDSNEALKALMNFANTLSRMGEHEKAISIKKEVLEKRKKKYGEDHLLVSSVENSIGTDYEGLKEFEKCLEYRIKVYEKRCRLNGEDDRLTIRATSLLGKAYQGVGDMDNATLFQEKAYEKCGANLEDDDSDYYIVRCNLSKLYYENKEYEKALKVLIETTEMFDDYYDNPDEEVTEITNILADVYGKLGMSDKAEEVLKKLK